jgi:hypothetical protein
MISLDEKRVHGPDTDPETAIVASETGVGIVSLAGGRVGSVSLRYREPAHDVATEDGRIVVGTDEGVLELVVPADGNDPDGRAIRELGGPAPTTALAVDEQGTVLAGGDGGLARRNGNREWHSLGSVEPREPMGETRAIDGDFLASSEGVFRVAGDELRYSGLDDAADVSSVGIPHTATAEGLYALGNGWLAILEGGFSVVAADPETAGPGALGRAHAVSSEDGGADGGSDDNGSSDDGSEVYEHVDGNWQRRALPTDDRVVDVAYGKRPYAVTEKGTFLVSDGDEWRTHPLGLRGVRALAIAFR